MLMAGARLGAREVIPSFPILQHKGLKDSNSDKRSAGKCQVPDGLLRLAWLQSLPGCLSLFHIPPHVYSTGRRLSV